MRVNYEAVEERRTLTIELTFVYPDVLQVEQQNGDNTKDYSEEKEGLEVIPERLDTEDNNSREHVSLMTDY